jgi:hypothetical protein
MYLNLILTIIYFADYLCHQKTLEKRPFFSFIQNNSNTALIADVFSFNLRHFREIGSIFRTNSASYFFYIIIGACQTASYIC